MARIDRDSAWFEAEKHFHETKYLEGSNPRQQSGFGRDERDWERFRRPIVAAIDRSGSFLDIGCANGLLMEDIRRWAHLDGSRIEPYGLEISERLAALARGRLPEWQDRIFVGNALYWEPPLRFDYVRTELVYVPDHRRRQYVERLLADVVVPGGVLILCSYGSSRPEGNRSEPLVDELRAWNLEIAGTRDVISPMYSFVITRVVWLRAPGSRGGRLLSGDGAAAACETVKALSELSAMFHNVTSHAAMHRADPPAALYGYP